MVEVYGWLSWACSGTTRGMRNRPFDAVLLRRDGGNREVPPGGWAAPEDHERVLWAVIWLNSLAQQGPDMDGFPGGGGLCSASRMRMPTTGSPGPCATPSPTGATAGGTRHRRSPSPGVSDDAGDGHAPPAQAMSARGWGGNSAAGRPPPRQGRAPAPAPAPEHDPHPPPHRMTRQRGAHHLH